MKSFKRLLLLVALPLFYCCGGGGSSAEKEPVVRQLNITVLIDLSDRISLKKNPANPQYFERDIEIVKEIVEVFKDSMAENGLFMAKGKIRVMFTPYPESSEINELAKSLSIDLSKMKDTKEKRDALLTLGDQFSQSLKSIYDLSTNAEEYKGSDIWRFFKDDIADYCVEKSPEYSNILFLLTDGYLYHEESMLTEGNRTSYINSKTLKMFKNVSDWKKTIDEKNYGLIASRTDLNNLDVVVLEISGIDGNKTDEDIIKYYLEKWFKEMNVAHFETHSTDLPAHTRTRIQNYFKSRAGDAN